MLRISCLLILLGTTPVLHAAEPQRKTQNVVLIMLDGIRWEDAFTGAEETLLNSERGGVANVTEIRKRFWRDTPEDRRVELLPFLWTHVAKQGQIFGNQHRKSVGRVTNGLNFSYPGYNEILCGYADPRVNSNAKIENRNVTILEWLNRKAEFQGRVAAFASWDVFPYIINTRRSGIPVNAGLVPLTEIDTTPEVKLLNRLIAETPLFGEDVRPDAFTYHAAKLYLEAKKPRLLFLSFDETDAQAHAGRYDRVLESARKADRYIRDLWETMQGMKEYKDRTTFIITTDHGRGGAPVGWKNHSSKIPGSEFWWVAILGPDTPPLGEREKLDTVFQSQIPVTIAALLGFDYQEAVPLAAPALPGVIQKQDK